LKEALKGDNIDDIKAKQEELQKLVYDMSIVPTLLIS